jgi:hypothetical protein
MLALAKAFNAPTAAKKTAADGVAGKGGIVTLYKELGGSGQVKF